MIMSLNKPSLNWSFARDPTTSFAQENTAHYYVDEKAQDFLNSYSKVKKFFSTCCVFFFEIFPKKISKHAFEYPTILFLGFLKFKCS